MSTRSIIDPNRAATRLPPANNRFLDSSSDEEEEDEETRLQREEDEQERLLSEQFGEAEESSGQKRKSEEDIEAEYASATRKKARRRPTLTPLLLTGSKGLVRISSEFPRQIQWPNKQHKVTAAATYSRTLVHAYKSFCYDLFPNGAFQDVLSRMESLGSKKEVKDYLQHLREGVRNAHLETIYGKEKAQAMIQELEQGLKQQQDEYGNEEMMDEGPREYELRRGPVRGPEANTAAAANGGGDEDEAPSSNTETTASPQETPAQNPSSVAAQTTTTNPTLLPQDANKNDDLQDSDDELEFVVSSKPAPVNPFADDDDDDDEEEEIEQAPTSTGTQVANKDEADNEQEDTMDTADVDNKAQEEETVVDDDTNESMKMDSPVPNKNNETPTDDEEPSETTTSPPIAAIDAQMESPVAQETQGTEDVQDDDMVCVPPQQEEEESVPSCSEETATIVPTMTESQFDDIATQQEGEDSQYVGTEPLLAESQAETNQEQE